MCLQITLEVLICAASHPVGSATTDASAQLAFHASQGRMSLACPMQRLPGPLKTFRLIHVSLLWPAYTRLVNGLVSKSLNAYNGAAAGHVQRWGAWRQAFRAAASLCALAERSTQHWDCGGGWQGRQEQPQRLHCNHHPRHHRQADRPTGTPQSSPELLVVCHPLSGLIQKLQACMHQAWILCAFVRRSVA